MAVVISDRLLESSDRLLDAEPDEQLTSLVHSGHEAAFAAIVRRYERELQAQARRLTSDGRGEDAVQQAFLNAFAALQAGREVRHLRGWLHQILRNEVIRARVPVDAPLEAATVYGEPLEDTVQLRATAHATLAELSALPDRQRDALLGTAVFGFARADVARTMGLSEGAVRQLVHRARLRLRQAASALIPFPLARLFGAAGSGVDAAPAALGAGATASGGLAIKVGALLASGAVATGIAVTHTFASHHRAAQGAGGPGHHVSRARAPARTPRVLPAPGSPAVPGDTASTTNSVRLREHGPAGVREADHFHGGPARLSGTRSGRHGGAGAGRGHGQGGPSSGRGNDGSDPRGGTSSGPGRDGSAPGAASGPGSGAGSRSGDDGSRSGSGHGGSGSSGGDGSGSSSAARSPVRRAPARATAAAGRAAGMGRRGPREATAA